MKYCEQSISKFITKMARKVDILYPNNCADEEDYIQAGHLKLAEIRGNRCKKRDFRAYAIISIARAMRQTALGAMGAASAPDRIKKLVHRIELLLAASKTEQEICHELKIDIKTLASFKSLINTESWHRLFNEPTLDADHFSVVDDILSSCYLTGQDKEFLQAQLDDDIDSIDLNRKQQWSLMKKIRPKLIRSGYEV